MLRSNEIFAAAGARRKRLRVRWDTTKWSWRRCRRAQTWAFSCGNPTAIAELKPGEAVVDLGSGGGFDVFIAARKVGPVADNSVNVIISNCVINLSPDKPQVWREMFRVLKPGGRVAVFDLVLLQPLPREVAEMIEALVGCIAGAVLVKDTEQMARGAGFTGLATTEKQGCIDALADWNDPLFKKILDNLPASSKMSDFVTSLYVTAKKPARCCCC